MIFRIKLHWWCSLLATGALLAAAWGWGGWPQWQGSLRSVGSAAAWGLAGGGLCLVVNYCIGLVLRAVLRNRYERLFRRYAMDVIGDAGPIDAVAGGLMAALGEEPIFRGVLLPAFSWAPLGLIASAFLFALAHYLPRQPALFFWWAMAEGVFFGTLYLVTESVLVPAVAHGTFDTLGFLYFQRLRALARQGS